MRCIAQSWLQHTQHHKIQPCCLQGGKAGSKGAKGNEPSELELLKKRVDDMEARGKSVENQLYQRHVQGTESSGGNEFEPAVGNAVGGADNGAAAGGNVQ